MFAAIVHAATTLALVLFLRGLRDYLDGELGPTRLGVAFLALTAFAAASAFVHLHPALPSP